MIGRNVGRPPVQPDVILSGGPGPVEKLDGGAWSRKFGTNENGSFLVGKAELKPPRPPRRPVTREGDVTRAKVTLSGEGWWGSVIIRKLFREESFSSKEK